MIYTSSVPAAKESTLTIETLRRVKELLNQQDPLIAWAKTLNPEFDPQTHVVFLPESYRLKLDTTQLPGWIMFSRYTDRVVVSRFTISGFSGVSV